MDQRIIVGIDLGSSNICLAAGKINYDNELELIAKVQKLSEGIEKGRIVDENAASAALDKVFREVDLLVGEMVTDCYITVPSGLCTIIDFNSALELKGTGDKISKEHIKKLKDKAKNSDLLYEKKFLQFLSPCYRLDGKYIADNPVGMRGSLLELEGRLLAMDYKIYKEYIKLFNSLNRNIIGIRAACEAASELLIDERDKKRGIILVDVGAQKTDIAVYHEGTVQYMSQILLGGDNVTKDLAYCLKVPIEKAERLKKKYDHPDSSANTSGLLIENEELAPEIIDARISEVINFIEAQLKKASLPYDINNMIIYGSGIIHFDNLKTKLAKISDKNISIVRSSHFNLINSRFINAWGLVKLIYYELKWEYNGQFEIPKSIEENITSNYKDIGKHKKNKSVLSRIKSFLGDFF